ncbi:MAG: tol-pal system-associated acyl-CoA thioesterase [Pseudomonadota bacterium]
MAASEFSLSLRVYIEDTDAGGIVYYVNYLKFMERARTEYMRSLGYDREHIFDAGNMFVVRDVQLRYVQPARLDDELQVTVRPVHVGAAVLVMEQTVERSEHTLVHARVEIVYIDRVSMQPCKMSGPVREHLRSLLSS